MKISIKELLESAADTAVGSSKTVITLTKAIRIVAEEMKRLAELSLKIHERLEAHEKIIIELCNLYAENAKKSTATADFVKSKQTSKPN